MLQRGLAVTVVSAPMSPDAQISRIAARFPLASSPRSGVSSEHQGTIMKNSIVTRGLRTALLGFSGALLLGLAACGNTYGPPVAGQPLTWGQQHYLDNQKAIAAHEARRADHGSKGFHP